MNIIRALWRTVPDWDSTPRRYTVYNTSYTEIKVNNENNKEQGTLGRQKEENQRLEPARITEICKEDVKFKGVER